VSDLRDDNGVLAFCARTLVGCPAGQSGGCFAGPGAGNLLAGAGAFADRSLCGTGDVADAASARAGDGLAGTGRWVLAAVDVDMK